MTLSFLAKRKNSKPKHNHFADVDNYDVSMWRQFEDLETFLDVEQPTILEHQRFLQRRALND